MQIAHTNIMTKCMTYMNNMNTLLTYAHTMPKTNTKYE